MLYGVIMCSCSGDEGFGNFDVFLYYVGIGSGYDNWLW